MDVGEAEGTHREKKREKATSKLPLAASRLQKIEDRNRFSSLWIEG